MSNALVLRPGSAVALMLCLVAAFASVSVEPAHAGTLRPAEKKLVRLINDTRAAEGLSRLKVGTKPKPVRGHSKKMVRQQALFHSDFSSTLKGVNWKTAGENVGVASTIAKTHDGYMASSPHKANILSKSWDRIVVGVARDSDGMVWTTVVFYST